MSARSSLNELLASEIEDALGDEDRLKELMASLISGLGIAIAASSDGDMSRSGQICVDSARLLFTAAAEASPLFVGARQ